MKNATKKILFSIDLEEFDIPEEYGQTVPLEEKLGVSMAGMLQLDALMARHKVTATIFTTAFWASHYPGYVKQLAGQHEIASHTYYHNTFKTEDLATSREVLSNITGQDITGLRMPRMQPITAKDVLAAGYLYDSSLNPTLVPGRYNNFYKPRTLFKEDGLWELPASVTPMLRIPIFWLAFKNFPFAFYKQLCKRILDHDGYLVFYVHPWEFADLAPYKLPAMVKRTHGSALLQRLDMLFTYLAKQGVFEQHRDLVLSGNG